jgi:hypothetical protein
VFVLVKADVKLVLERITEAHEAIQTALAHSESEPQAAKVQPLQELLAKNKVSFENSFYNQADTIKAKLANYSSNVMNDKSADALPAMNY